MAEGANWALSLGKPVTISALTAQEGKDGEHTIHFHKISRTKTTSDLSTSTLSVMDNSTATLAVEDANVAAASTATPSVRPTTPARAASGKISGLESDEDSFRVTRSQSKRRTNSNVVIHTNRPLVWHSGPYKVIPCNEDLATIITPSPSSSAPPGAEIIVISSSDEEDPNALPNAAEIIVISSDTSDGGVFPTASSNRNESVYDAAEGLPIDKRKKHYFDLGRKMKNYTEMRLKRIIDNPKSSSEDYFEAMYQLHRRYPKHKQGRAVEAWRK